MIYQGQNVCCFLDEQQFAHIDFDLAGESVNKFNQQTLAELSEAVTQLKRQTDCQGLMLTSRKAVFFVGADIMEFLPKFQWPEAQLAQWLQSVHQLFCQIEDLPFPTVTVINGLTLGGGCELALSTDYRIMAPDAKIGLPEVKLGIFPGWGGTVRLPRLAGLDTALEWIASGAEQTAAAALKSGVCDMIIAADQLQNAATDVLQKAQQGQLNWQQRRQQKTQPCTLNKLEQTMAFETAKGYLTQKIGQHYPAPYAALNVMEQHLTLSRAQAIDIEIGAFVQVAKSKQAECLVTLFLNDQQLKKQAKQAGKHGQPIQHAAVLGAGIMGGGIAYQSASKKIPITMKDIRPEALEQGMGEAAQLLSKQLQRGRMSPTQLAQTLSRIHPTLHYTAMQDAELVVEAVVENPAIKQQVLQETEQHLSETAILTSNTSTISIDLLAQGLQRPENFCGMHFFNPVHRMPLVEVIKGQYTSELTLQQTVAYASALGKSPIVVNDCPGFYVNRVLFPYFIGFSQLVAEGVDFVIIDRIMEQFGWPMGPAYLLDVVGLDTACHASAVLAQGYPDRMQQSTDNPVARLYQQQRLGQKNQRGFYNHSIDSKGKPRKTAAEEVYPLLNLQPKHQPFSERQIIERMMLPMLIEVARCVEESIIATVAEADMGLIYGLGFPPFRGGPLKYMDQQGLASICEQADQYAHLGKLYQPTAQMRQMAAQQQTYYHNGGQA